MKMVAPADLMFLLLETLTTPMHVGALNIYTPPADARADYVANLVAGWKSYRQALPPFNQRPQMRRGLIYWEEAGDFDLDMHIQHLALPAPGGVEELQAMVSRLHGVPLDRRRPLWEVSVIEGLRDGRFAIYLKLHHALVDGVTAANMFGQYLSADEHVRKAPIWAYEFERVAAGAAQSTLFGNLDALLQAGRQLLPGVLAGIWDMLRPLRKGSAEALPLQAPPSLLNVAVSDERIFAMQSFSLRRLKKLGQAGNATVNDILLAISAGALREYLLARHKLPKKSLIAMLPVSLYEPESGGGNQISLMLARLATHIADPRRRLQAIVKSTRAAKQRMSLMSRLEKWAYITPMVAVAAPLMLSGDARRHPLFNVIISNVPGPAGTLYMNGARLDEIYPVSIPADYLSLNITLTGCGDHLGVGYIGCRKALPDLACMPAFAEKALSELEQALFAKPSKPAGRAGRTKAAASRSKKTAGG
jgi:diacylglycerol O-acyltransferase